ncbi:hypothetical protein GCM10022631_35050 [Deinococcus rubellus]|uniref:histidine kinase n=1 Tax=Deinococcus rubellus TaxID=1889240 RepID=A0ABY5YFR7_9DEIO|nr:HAMP domain-containing sensor histidine kinase [Deinococcus rubellus]UWX63556.1 HAMP domain-containing histidine kinase [Deinococcus rubellus]
MKLGVRLALLIALIVTGALLAQGFLGFLTFRQTANAALRNDLSTYLAALAHDRNEGDTPTYLPNENGIRARLIRREKVIQEYGGPFPQTATQHGDDDKHSDEWLTQQLAVPDLGAGTLLQASIPLRSYHQGLAAYLATVTLSVVVMSLLGVAAALLVSRSMVRPISDLSRAAERVAQSGQLDERVDAPQGQAEIARLARSFNTMLQRLSAFRQRETEFVRHASHEFRTPLAALRAQVDANAQGWISDAELIATVDQQVERLTALTGALLLLSRENSAEHEIFDLAEIGGALAQQHGAAYCGPAHLPFSGSQALLSQVLINLLINVNKYAPGVAATVGLSAANQQIVLSVSDAGPGVPPEALPRLMEAFYRVPGTRESGSGLGLAIVQRVAEVHGGTVQLASTSPHGLTVNLHLPNLQASLKGNAEPPR